MSRDQRIKDEWFICTFTPDNDVIMRSLEGEGAHIIKTDGSDAIECTCHDWGFQKPEGGCAHMRAWEQWEVNELYFGDDLMWSTGDRPEGEEGKADPPTARPVA